MLEKYALGYFFFQQTVSDVQFTGVAERKNKWQEKNSKFLAGLTRAVLLMRVAALRQNI